MLGFAWLGTPVRDTATWPAILSIAFGHVRPGLAADLVASAEPCALRTLSARSPALHASPQIWDVREGHLLYTLHGHEGAVPRPPSLEPATPLRLRARAHPRPLSCTPASTSCVLWESARRTHARETAIARADREARPTAARDAPPGPHLHRDGCRRLPHLHRDWAHCCHICTVTGLTPPTSAPGLGPRQVLGTAFSPLGDYFASCGADQQVRTRATSAP